MALTFKSIGKKIGGVLKKAAPAAMFIPGVGPVAAGLIGAAAGAGGSLLEGKNAKSHLKYGAIGGAGAGVGKVGLNALASRIPGKIPAPGEIGAKAGKAGGGSLLDRAGSLLRGGASSLVGGAGGKIGLADLLMGGLTAAGGVKSYKDSAEARKREGQLTDKQLAIADEQAGMGRELFAGARPARIAAQIALEDRLKKGARAPVDYSQFTDTANPFAKKFAAAPALPPPAPRPQLPVEPRLALPNPRKRKLLTAGAAV
jgi:hypothetical protein